MATRFDEIQELGEAIADLERANRDVIAFVHGTYEGPHSADRLSQIAFEAHERLVVAGKRLSISSLP